MQQAISKAPNVFIKAVTATNSKQLTTIKNIAFFGLIMPAGISRFAVLAFCTSISLSKYRLKAIAAFRANTIHKTTYKKSFQSNG